MIPLFQTGQRSRNRHGAYTVLELDGDAMTIRYDDGEEMQVKQAFQARIQKNMTIDDQVAEQLAPTEKHRRCGSVRGASRLTPRGWGSMWHGLMADDFAEGVAGTHWRARSSLGGAIGAELSEYAHRALSTFPPYRVAEVHIYDPAVYDESNRQAQSKFVVKMCDTACWYGLCVERNTETMDAHWDWTRLLPALADNEILQDALWQAIKVHKLVWKVMDDDDAHQLATFAAAETKGDLLMQLYEDDVPLGEATTTGWSDLVTFLDEGHIGSWMNLYLVRALPKNEALALGESLASQAAQAMATLLPLYQACTLRA